MAAATKAQQSQEVLPPEEAQAIAALDEAKRQIDIARVNQDVDALLEWADRAAAVQHYIKRRDEARELADNAGEIKVRAEAALGRLDLAAVPGRGRPPKKEESEAEEDEPVVSPLADFQTARRSAFRTLGRLDTKQLDEVVDKLRSEDDGGVTTSRAVREARQILPIEHREAGPAGKPSKEARKEMVTDYAQHIRALANEISTLVRLGRKLEGVATPSERQRMSVRLKNEAVRVDDLADFLDTGGEAEGLVGSDTED
jgi:hypothetical protein